MAKKITTTIAEFLKIARAEWREHEDSIKHGDDSIPFSEWTSEWANEYRKKYGIYWDKVYDRWEYDGTNAHFRGYDICPCCEERFEATDSELCPECDEIDF